MKTFLRSAAVVFVLAGVAACADTQASIDRHIKDGDEAYQRGEYSRAVLEYRNAVKLDNKLTSARLKLADSYLKVGDRKRAVAEYLRVADLQPGDPTAELNAGNAMLVAGLYTDAKARAEKILASHPKNADAQILLGYSLAGLKDLKGAVKELQSALELTGQRSDIAMNLGALRIAEGSRAQAEAAFLSATVSAPNAIEPKVALADFYLADGKVDKAEGILRQAVAIRPLNAEASRALGNILAGTKRLDEAEQHFLAAADASKDPSYRVSLGDFYVFKGDSAKARATWESLSGQSKASTDVALRMASLDFAEGKKDSAYARIESVIKTQRETALANTMKGEFLTADGRPGDALAAFKIAVASDPAFVRAQYGLGGAYVVLRDAAAAEKAFAEVLKLNSTFAPAQVEIGRLHLAAGRVDLALQFATRAVENRPGYAPGRLLHAQALLATNDLRGAEEATRVLVQAMPDWPQAHAQDGALRVTKGDLAGARAAFERAQKLSPDSVEALRGLVLIARRSGQKDVARATIEGRLAKSGNSPDLLAIAADVYADAGDARNLEKTLQKLIEVDPANLHAYDRLGELYIRNRRMDEAMAIFSEAVKNQPDAVGPRTMLGYMHHMQGRTDDAVKAYEATVGLDRNAVVASNNLAWIYAERGEKLDQALLLAQAAKQRLPESPEVADTLGWVYYKKDLPHLAIEAFQQSARLDPKRAEYQFHLGLAYMKRGESARAREALQRALALQPDFAGAADARRALATLER